jgi:hypothetical protein
MGYRSQVSYIIAFKDNEQRETFKELVKHKDDEHMISALVDDCFSHPTQPWIYFQVDHWKWYDSYPEVQAHNNLMEFAMEVFPKDAAYRFVRVGEEHDDIEIRDDEGEEARHSLYDYLHPITTINLDI